MNWMVLAAFFISALVLSAASIRMLLPVLRRRQIVDHPNERSSHIIPTPRGAGLTVVPVVALLWIALDLGWMDSTDHVLVYAAGGALVLCVLSWFDDLKGLPPLARLCAHILVVAGLLSLFPSGVSFSQGLLPFWADRLLAGFAWLWFINLFNFMDGIDGISGVEAGAICLGIIVLSLVKPFLHELAFPAAIIAGAACGFLLLNWHPAKIFLGDSGSVPLGLLLGWMLLYLAAAGLWSAALILPLYYFVDATITISRRLLRGEKIWRAHRQHYYQRAVAGGLTHARVSTMIAIANMILIVLAFVSILNSVSAWAALAAAAMVVFFLLLMLRRHAVPA